MHLVEVGVEALAQLDSGVAAGQLLGPGMPAPLPPIRRATFDALIALPPLLRAPSQVATQAATLRRSAPASVNVPKQTIRVGSIVLASVAKSDGWWEAEVVAIAPGNMLRLRWREFPGLDLFEKPVEAVSVAPLHIFSTDLCHGDTTLARKAQMSGQAARAQSNDMHSAIDVGVRRS
jgi:hypothetical protein